MSGAQGCRAIRVADPRPEAVPLGYVVRLGARPASPRMHVFGVVWVPPASRRASGRLARGAIGAAPMRALGRGHATYSRETPLPPTLQPSAVQSAAQEHLT